MFAPLFDTYFYNYGGKNGLKKNLVMENHHEKNITKRKRIKVRITNAQTNIYCICGFQYSIYELQ